MRRSPGRSRRIKRDGDDADDGAEGGRDERKIGAIDASTAASAESRGERSRREEKTRRIERHSFPPSANAIDRLCFPTSEAAVKLARPTPSAFRLTNQRTIKLIKQISDFNCLCPVGLCSQGRPVLPFFFYQGNRWLNFFFFF